MKPVRVLNWRQVLAARTNERLIKAKAVCERKMSYQKLSHAQGVLERMKSQGASKRLNVYRCSHCEKWHIGHRPKPKPKKLSETVLADIVRVLKSNGITGLDGILDTLKQREYSITKRELIQMLLNIESKKSNESTP